MAIKYHASSNSKLVLGDTLKKTDFNELNGVSEVLGKLLMQAQPSDMEACERMYQSKWRSEPFPASALDAEVFEEFEYDLRFAAAGRLLGGKPGPMDSEEAIEDWYERVGEIAAGLPPAVTTATLLVELATYKGEGDGFAVFEHVKHLPVFVSKQHSAAQFNC